MSAQSRKERGRRTEKVVAEWFRNRGWPHAEPQGAGRQGTDITGMICWNIEVKARAGFDPLSWLRQSRKAGRGSPIVVIRCNGQGEDASEYLAMTDLATMTTLMQVWEDAGPS